MPPVTNAVISPDSTPPPPPPPPPPQSPPPPTSPTLPNPFLWRVTLTTLARFKKMVMHLRQHCSFVQLRVCPTGMLWVGTSSIDHLTLRMRLDKEHFESFESFQSSDSCKTIRYPANQQADRDRSCCIDCIELNMFQLYRIIKRASSFRYERICLSGCSAVTTSSVQHSPPCPRYSPSLYRVLTIRFETQNKCDVYHMRCPLLVVPTPPTSSKSPTPPTPPTASTSPTASNPPSMESLLWTSPMDLHHPLSRCPSSKTRLCWWSIPTDQFDDALQRFDHETFRTIRIRQHSRTISLSPDHNPTLTLRSKTDSVSGSVHLPAHVPPMESTTNQTHSSNRHSCSSSSSSSTPAIPPKGRYTLSSVCQTVRFAMVSKTRFIRLALQPTPEGTTILHLCFDWMSATHPSFDTTMFDTSWTHVWFPPVSDNHPSGHWISSSSSSDNEC